MRLNEYERYEKTWYYQHRIDPKIGPETVAEVMAELIKEGKILSWGISETTEEYLCRSTRKKDSRPHRS